MAEEDENGVLSKMLEEMSKGDVHAKTFFDDSKHFENKDESDEESQQRRMERERLLQSDEICKVLLSKHSLRVVEGGACDFYTIKLSCKPQADVMVQIDDQSGQVRTSPKVIRFSFDAKERGDFGYWDTPQIVRVMAIDDDNVESMRETAELTHCSLSGDLRFSSMTGKCVVVPSKLPVEIVDNDGGFVYTFGEICGKRDMVPAPQQLRTNANKSNGNRKRKESVGSEEFSASSFYSPASEVLQDSGRASTSESDRTGIVEESIRTLACGANHLGVVLTDGRLLTLGSGGEGQLCHGDFKNRIEFSAWRSIDRDGILRSKITQVACGAQHTALVTDDGRLLMCGSNAKGQLGLCDGPNAGCSQCLEMITGSSSPSSDAASEDGVSFAEPPGKKHHHHTHPKTNPTKRGPLESSTICAVPRVVENLAHLFVERVACGEGHTVVLASTGSSNTDRGVVKCKIFGWGDTMSGALGCELKGIQRHPVELKELSAKDPFQVSCGAHFTAVLCGSGDLYTSGWGLYGCFGRRAQENSPDLNSFVQITVPKKSKEEHPLFVEVATGHSHLGVLTDNQQVYVCGNNESGQLGLGDRIYRSVLTRVPFLSGVGVSTLAFGMFHSCASTWDGDLYVWGSNDHGQLGLGTQALQQDIPVLQNKVTVPVKQVHAGKAFTSLILHKAIPKHPPADCKLKVKQYQDKLEKYWKEKRAADKQRQERKLASDRPALSASRAKDPARLRRARVVDADKIRKNASFLPYEMVTRFTPRIIKRPPGVNAARLERRPKLGGRSLVIDEDRGQTLKEKLFQTEKPEMPRKKLLKGRASPRAMRQTHRGPVPGAKDLVEMSAEQLVELHKSIYGGQKKLKSKAKSKARAKVNNKTARTKQTLEQQNQDVGEGLLSDETSLNAREQVLLESVITTN